MCSLNLPDGLVEDGVLAVSEPATNAVLHASPADEESTGAELWIWARTLPRPQLVVSVFDTDRTSMPRTGPTELLDESGKGLAIVEALASEWGAHFTRSRLGPVSRPGKRVWFCMALPGPWPSTLRVVSASLASKRLLDLLRLRGIDATRRAYCAAGVVTDAKMDYLGEHLTTDGMAKDDVTRWLGDRFAGKPTRGNC